jgi:methylated-DNA-[protein]-cysteine S-methyltransferase
MAGISKPARATAGDDSRMRTRGLHYFDTAIGRCALAWGARGITGVQLPEHRESETRARMQERFPGAVESPPPGEVAHAVGRITALLRGEPSDLSAVALDMEGVPPFQRRVYDAAREIPAGATLTYGEVAAKIGLPGAARAVGQALGRNPFVIVVPCHRVLAAGGKVGGFSGGAGIATKLRMLGIEAAAGRASQFDGDGAFGFDPAAAVAHLREADPALAELIDRVGPFRMQLRRAPSIFAALAEAIVYQQLNGRAAASIFARLCALYPVAQGLSAESLLRTSERSLRGVGLSTNKLLSIRDLARKAAGGEIPTLAEAHGMDDEALIETLTQVRGIGRWTVEMLLMSRLGRPDILPVDDYGIRAGFAYLHRKRKMPAPKALLRPGAQWKPYRTVASWYLWRAADLAKEAKA